MIKKLLLGVLAFSATHQMAQDSAILNTEPVVQDSQPTPSMFTRFNDKDQTTIPPKTPRSLSVETTNPSAAMNDHAQSNNNISRIVSPHGEGSIKTNALKQLSNNQENPSSIKSSVATPSIFSESSSTQTSPSLINKQDQLLPPDMPASRPTMLPTHTPLINFSYNNTEITDIISDLQELKHVNLLLPKMADKIEGKVTISLDHKISVDEAWNLLNTILDIAGYSIVLTGGDMLEIVKNSKTITHEPVPLYIATPLNRLPDSGRIRYLTYLSNIRVSEKDPGSELNQLLTQLLPSFDNSLSNKPFRMDENTNALLLTAAAPDIKAVMSIINQLDKPGFQEKLEVIKLRHTVADTVVELFKSLLQSPADMNRYHLDTQKLEDLYFMRSTKLFSEGRTNAVIVVGKSQAINRVVNFIRQYIDVEPESGKSILHVVQLQYLEAAAFAAVLDRIVKSEHAITGTKQATAQSGIATGPERFFEGVIIKADTPSDISQPNSTDTTARGAQPTQYHGGNKLIIAARTDDWKRIKKLIEELDVPRRSVLLEVLIADLTVNDQRLLGTVFRNPAKLPFVNQAAIQSVQVPPQILPDSCTSPQTIGFNQNPDGSTIASDLLRVGFNSAGACASGTDATQTFASFIPAGGTALSFNDPDGKTFALAQLVQLFGYDKVLSHPHVISTDNTQAEVSIGQERMVPDTGSGGVGGTILKNTKLGANLKVVITPRISASGTVNLAIGIDINQFIPTDVNNPAQAVRTRHVATNAIVQSGGILALGGLVQVTDTENVNKIPILGDIPIFGFLGKQRGSNVVKNSLTVFICPTIIEPRFRAGASEYTQDYITLAENYAHTTGLFDSLRDPITRWFFKPDQEPEGIMHQFLKKDELKPDDLYDDKDKRRRKKAMIQQAVQEPPIMVQKVNKPELNDQLKNKVAQTENPFKKVTRDQEPSAKAGLRS